MKYSKFYSNLQKGGEKYDFNHMILNRSFRNGNFVENLNKGCYHVCYPKRSNGLLTVFFKDDFHNKRDKVGNKVFYKFRYKPDFYLQFMARFREVCAYSKEFNILFVGNLLIPGKPLSYLIDRIFDNDFSDIIFVCDDCIVNGDSSMPYRDRLSHIPEALPHFVKESTVAIPPKSVGFVSDYFEVVSDFPESFFFDGIVIRPDLEPLSPSYNVLNNYFFHKTK